MRFAAWRPLALGAGALGQTRAVEVRRARSASRQGVRRSTARPKTSRNSVALRLGDDQGRGDADGGVGGLVHQHARARGSDSGRPWPSRVSNSIPVHSPAARTSLIPASALGLQLAQAGGDALAHPPGVAGEVAVEYLLAARPMPAAQTSGLPAKVEPWSPGTKTAARLLGQAGADGQAPGEALGQGHDVRLDAVAFVGPQGPGAAHAALHFVQDQQHALARRRAGARPAGTPGWPG